MKGGGSSLDEVFASIRRKFPEIASMEEDPGSRMRVALGVFGLRVGNGWTQRELARRAGMTQPRLARIEAGEVNFGIDTLDRLAAALQVPVAELFAKKPRSAATAPIRAAAGAPVRHGGAAAPRARKAADRAR